MKHHFITAVSLTLACAYPVQAQQATTGIDRAQFDTTVRIQDDFNQHISGTWLKKTEIPADKSSWGAFQALHEMTQPQLRSIVEAAAKNPGKAGSEAQKIGDLYASFMDDKQRTSLGIKALQKELTRISALSDKKQIPALIAHFNEIGVNAPYELVIHQDAKDATKYIADIGQSGLGLPDRDYYLKDDDAKLKDVRLKYLAHIDTMLTKLGDKNAAQSAKDILALETELARVQWTKVENRDPVKTYNQVELSKLATLMPGYDWTSYLNAAGVGNKVPYLVISQPSYLKGMTALHPAVRKKEARKHGLPRAYEAAAAAAALAASNRALVASQAEVRAAAIAAAEKRRRKTAAVYRQHTPRGQPVMAGRMAALLGKVERAVGR